MRAISGFIAVLILFGQTVTPNSWDGTWVWGTYAERVAYGEAVIAQTAQIAQEHCGEPYFGTVCS